MPPTPIMQQCTILTIFPFRRNPQYVAYDQSNFLFHFVPHFPAGVVPTAALAGSSRLAHVQYAHCMHDEMLWHDACADPAEPKVLQPALASEIIIPCTVEPALSTLLHAPVLVSPPACSLTKVLLPVVCCRIACLLFAAVLLACCLHERLAYVVVCLSVLLTYCLPERLACLLFATVFLAHLNICLPFGAQCLSQPIKIQ